MGKGARPPRAAGGPRNDQSSHRGGLGRLMCGAVAEMFMSGWKIEYIPAAGWGSPAFTSEKATLENAVDLAVDRGWERNVATIVAIHGPGSLIRGSELNALLAEARKRRG